MAKKRAVNTEPRIVAAVAVAMPQNNAPQLNELIHAAMVKAVEDYLAAGGSVYDAEELRQAQWDARDRVLAENAG